MQRDRATAVCCGRHSTAHYSHHVTSVDNVSSGLVTTLKVRNLQNTPRILGYLKYKGLANAKRPCKCSSLLMSTTLTVLTVNT